MFQPEHLIQVPRWPEANDLDRIVRYWDKAGTEGSGAYTAGALMAKRKSTKRTIILDVTRGQWGADKREQVIRYTAHQDVQRLGVSPSKYAVRVEQEPGSGGKDSAMWTVRNTLAGFNAAAIRKTQSKENEWAPLASQVNTGGVEMVVGPWNQPMKQEMESAPFGKYKDQLDALAGGFNYIWLGPSAGVIA